MREFDVVVLGGSAAGIQAAITAKRSYPEKSLLVVRKEEKVLIPCGIPYIFGTLGSPDKNLIPDAILANNNVELLLAEATKIDKENKILHTSEGEIKYEKLVLGTGSRPVVPPIPGIDKKGVYSVEKDVSYLSGLQEELKNAKNVVVIGGGFIGVEFADEINKIDSKNVTVVEMAEHCLSLAYDTEFCIEMEEYLVSRGVNVKTKSMVKEIIGNGKVENVVLASGEKIEADIVILGIGASANVELAKEAGLAIGTTGGIQTDRTLKTSEADIFACGDCSEKISFFGGSTSSLKLASIACSEGRVVGANLYGIKRQSEGTIGVWSTAVGDKAIATAGLTEAVAKNMGYDVVVAAVEGPNRHPGNLPGASKIKLKVVFERKSGVLLGGQVMGDSIAGEIVNVIAACVQNRMSANDISMMQIGTHPMLTASPLVYNLVNVADMAMAKMA